jgi:hypothetical protein
MSQMGADDEDAKELSKSLTMVPRIVSRIVVAGVVGLALGSISLAGVDGESNTDGFNPAAELYDVAEAQRLGKVAHQHALVDAIVHSIAYWPGDLWGPPIGGPPVRQPIGYESKQVGPNRWIYRPLYPEDVGPDGKPLAPNVEQLPVPEALPAPQVIPGPQPGHPAPSDAKPEDYIPPDGAGPRPGERGP